jgi:hypothetical protein
VPKERVIYAGPTVTIRSLPSGNFFDWPYFRRGDDGLIKSASLRPIALVAVFSTCVVAQVKNTTGESTEFFESHVRPLFAQKCFSCHRDMAMGGLQMKSRDAFLKGGNHGPAVVPGRPDQSLLIQAVQYTNPKLQMPPTGKLQDSDIESLVAWIKAGAVWPESKEEAAQSDTSHTPAPKDYVITPEQRKFWSFQPIRKPVVPEVKDPSWPKSDIDRFVLAKLEAEGLKPVRQADRRTLIRRATLDLIGLPPTPDEVDAFVNDRSPDAFAKVVDRLLASHHYGERWGRYWLDIARYADSKGGFFEDPYPNAFRYRDWVIQAFNQDMPYDLFIKAQLAADQLQVPNRDKLLEGLGFQALGDLGFPGMSTDDRVDVVARGILGLTVACAQCHNHKYDPIPTKDYYSLLGVFKSAQLHPIPLAPVSEVKAFDEQEKKISAMEKAIREFEEKQNNILTDILMKETSRLMVASWKVMTGAKTAQAAAAEAHLDSETLDRWIQYLKNPNKDHPYLKKWYEVVSGHPTEAQVKAVADEFQAFVLSINEEKKGIDDRNYVKLGGAAGFYDDKKRRVTELEFMDALKGRLWSDLAAAPYMNVGDGIFYPRGVYYYGPERMGTDEAEKVRQLALAEAGVKEDRKQDPIERFLYGEWKANLDSMYAELDALKKALPPQYPYLHAITDVAHPANIHVYIRGEESNPGEEAPRRFLQILCKDECKPFTQGSGRLELAEAITSPSNPLTARVIMNRVWAWHFGDGIVRTTSNFGLLGERPTNPELLDYLASRLIENHWSIKNLQRQIMLSATYALSTDQSPENNEKDAENRFHWRANFDKRLDVETLRDSILFVSGKLDETVGGPPQSLEDPQNHRRTVYGFINRRRLDGTLSLFDFPDPNATSEGRFDTVGPLQRLYFMNNIFVADAARDLVARLARAAGNEAKIDMAYRILYGRLPSASEKQLGLQFLKEGANPWPEYAQVLLGSSEFMSAN